MSFNPLNLLSKISDQSLSLNPSFKIIHLHMRRQSIFLWDFHQKLCNNFAHSHNVVYKSIEGFWSYWKMFLKDKTHSINTLLIKGQWCLINFSALVHTESIKPLEIVVLVNVKSSIYIYLMKSGLFQSKTVSIDIFAEGNKV